MQRVPSHCDDDDDADCGDDDDDKIYYDDYDDDNDVGDNSCFYLRTGDYQILANPPIIPMLSNASGSSQCV